MTPEKGSSGCAASTGVSAGHIGETALPSGKQLPTRQTRLFFYVYHEFDEGLTSLFNIETFYWEGSICMKA
ncbi:hypothetical protein, partial [Alkalicoccus luteus]|uniref:hypothetical protein n=1 Tax=Alkalicoccus luteus TaxID=1237094 RepID=UPI00197C7FF6